MLLHHSLVTEDAVVDVDAVNAALAVNLAEVVDTHVLSTNVRLLLRHVSLAEQRRSCTLFVGRCDVLHRGRPYHVVILCDWSGRFDWLRVDVYTRRKRARRDIAEVVTAEVRAVLLQDPAVALVAEHWQAARNRSRRYTDFVAMTR